MTDYALVILAFLSKEPQQCVHATDIAQNTHVNKPTTAKVLKILAKHGLLESYRGSTGGYKLTKLPQEISVAEIIQVLEGPMAIMDCTLGKEHCAIYSSCEINAPWSKINHVIIQALDKVKLSDLMPIAGNGDVDDKSKRN
jgi:FeS assembly SUF system regulator